MHQHLGIFSVSDLFVVVTIPFKRPNSGLQVRRLPRLHIRIVSLVTRRPGVRETVHLLSTSHRVPAWFVTVPPKLFLEAGRHAPIGDPFSGHTPSYESCEKSLHEDTCVQHISACACADNAPQHQNVNGAQADSSVYQVRLCSLHLLGHVWRLHSTHRSVYYIGYKGSHVMNIIS
ncbi:PREDICTED: uncharacterized protein LOC109469772 [Branchiostoma belcheri]|uniref:Uncharacterized protein LOC109469772 n=1 Tax=Branchiostoma belcheri TaxID=7741 RepID=A0A6P4YYS4_BRABE|nr:PREDICTED: uncharacterized protein LOC109469772 [Branchiostoma belcheri]